MTNQETDKKLVAETEFFTKYLRGVADEKVGVVVALVQDDVVCSGWSACFSGDSFSNTRGKAIAIRRAKAHEVCERRGYRRMPPFIYNNGTPIRIAMELLEGKLGRYVENHKE